MAGPHTGAAAGLGLVRWCSVGEMHSSWKAWRRDFSSRSVPVPHTCGLSLGEVMAQELRSCLFAPPTCHLWLWSFAQSLIYGA